MNSLKYIQSKLSRAIFGANNERIDFIIDSLSKQSPRERNIIIGISSAVLVILGIVAVFMYLSSLKSMESNLVSSFQVYNKIQVLKDQVENSADSFGKVVEDITQKKSGFILKSFLNAMGEEKGLRLDFDDVRAESSLPKNLKEALTEETVKVSISKISLKGMLDFLQKIEESDKILRITSLTVDRRYDNIQFFRVSFNVSSLKSKNL